MSRFLPLVPFWCWMSLSKYHHLLLGYTIRETFLLSKSLPPKVDKRHFMSQSALCSECRILNGLFCPVNPAKSLTSPRLFDTVHLPHHGWKQKGSRVQIALLFLLK